MNNLVFINQSKNLIFDKSYSLTIRNQVDGLFIHFFEEKKEGNDEPNICKEMFYINILEQSLKSGIFFNSRTEKFISEPWVFTEEFKDKNVKRKNETSFWIDWLNDWLVGNLERKTKLYNYLNLEEYENLVVNSITYSRSPLRITIIYEKEGNNVLLK